MDGRVGDIVARSASLDASAPGDPHNEVFLASAASKKKKPAPLPEAPKSFPAGVMAGDAQPSGAVLWTKYVGKKNLRVRVWRIDTVTIKGKEHKGKEHEKFVLVKQKKCPEPEDKSFVHVDVKGLEPGAYYRYDFCELAHGKAVARSPRGRFRTAIKPTEYATVKFGGTACTHQYGPRLKKTNRNLIAASHRKNLAFFLHAGDQLYCDAKEKPGPAMTRKAYRKRYQQAYARAGLKSLHAAFGMYNTWDDHEFFNNWQGDHDTKAILKDDHLKKKSKFPPGIKHKSAARVKKIAGEAKKCFFNHQPILTELQPIEDSAVGEIPKGCKHGITGDASPGPRSREKGKRKLWGSFRWGRTLELFILDCRSERNRRDGKYISDEQMKWLITGLHKSPAVFKLILNSSPIAFFPGKPKETNETNKAKAHTAGLTDDAVAIASKAKKKKRKKLGDRWNDKAFRDQRGELLSAAQCVGGVCFLSGDLHFGSVGGVDPQGEKYKNVGEVLMGPSGAWRDRNPTVRHKEEAYIHSYTEERPGKVPWTYASTKNNYAVIQANPVLNKKDEVDKEKSNLEIWFYSGKKQLHYEKRNYKMERVEEPAQGPKEK